MLSSVSSVTVDQLITMCPLNNVQSADVPAGCIAGIHIKHCTNPLTFAQCQSSYDQAFASSIFSSIGAVCPAWKSGPRSSACASAISRFTYDYISGYDDGVPNIIKLDKTHAQMLVESTLGSRVFAPCLSSATLTCRW